jgi:hypothetical protein
VRGTSASSACSSLIRQCRGIATPSLLRLRLHGGERCAIDPSRHA